MKKRGRPPIKPSVKLDKQASVPKKELTLGRPKKRMKLKPKSPPPLSY